MEGEELRASEAVGGPPGASDTATWRGVEAKLGGVDGGGGP